MSKKYDIAIVMGRFQPLHNQHAALFATAAAIADHVVAMVGSANRPRTPKNPFTADERRAMIEQWTGDNGERVVGIVALNDYTYSDSMWASDVQAAVANVSDALNLKDPRVVIVGCEKDSSSYYLRIFPQWKLHTVKYSDAVDATVIREHFLGDKSLGFIKGVVPQHVFQFLERFKADHEDYELLRHEKRIIDDYRRSWKAAPYAPTFVTADAVVVQSGHILLVRRKSAPGKGLLALPGGFVNQDETIREAIIRELREETRIKVPAQVLKGSIVEEKVFDAPGRSARGRTITHAGLILLEGDVLPKVKGSDDAASAAWYPIGELDAREFFEDHHDVIQYFKGRM